MSFPQLYFPTWKVIFVIICNCLCRTCIYFCQSRQIMLNETYHQSNTTSWEKRWQWWKADTSFPGALTFLFFPFTHLECGGWRRGESSEWCASCFLDFQGKSLTVGRRVKKHSHCLCLLISLQLLNPKCLPPKAKISRESESKAWTLLFNHLQIFLRIP